MLEMIANANWTRPIYVALTVGSENYMNLGDNFVQEGLANRITPFTTKGGGAKNFDTAKTYDNVMNTFKFGGVDKKGIYLDETVMRMCYTHRRLFASLAMNLISEGQIDKAKKVLDKCEKELPDYNVPHDYQSGSVDLARCYVSTDQPQKAQDLINMLWLKSSQYLVFYLSFDGVRFSSSQHDCLIHFYILEQLLNVQDTISKEQADKKEEQLRQMMSIYQSKGGDLE